MLEYSRLRKGSISLCHWIKKNSGFSVHKAQFRIHSVFKNFHSGERIRRGEDSYAGFTGYVRTEAESAKKKLRIQIYSDTCDDTID